MISARIDKDHDGNGGALWIVIEHQDPMDNSLLPIQEDEVLPILKACQKYLGESCNTQQK